MAPDPTEFVKLFIRHERRLYAYLLTVLGNASQAEDVLQQTCVVLWGKFGEFTPGSDFAAWAIQVAYLTARNHLRAKARSRVQFSQAMFEAAAERAAARAEEADALHDALTECLDQLATADRELIRRRYELAASVQTIAQQVGQSIHAVYRSLARIHAALLRCVTGKLAAGEWRMSQAGDPHEELLELLELLREERATQAQLERLEALVLADADAMQVYLRCMALTASLRYRLQGLPGLAAAAVGQQPRAPGLAKPQRPRRWVIALATAAALMLVLWLNWPEPQPTAEPIVLTQVTGDVRVIHGDGTSEPARAAAELRAGDTLKSAGAGSSAVLTFADGTQLLLVNDASLTCLNQGRKSVLLHDGVVSARVTLQPADRPMLLATPAAQVEVLGTQFAVAASRDRTELNVSAGRVRLRRVSDGQTIEVAEGQGVITNGAAPLVVRGLAAARDAWDVDFESGLPKGWWGSFVTTELPAGSRGAVRATRDDSFGHVVWKIVTREEWLDGLFVLHADSHLHVTLKMERPDWLNIFLSTRGPEPTQPSWALHQFNEVPFWPPQPGQWRTVTIPLAQFKRKRDGVFHQEPPIVGEVAYSLSISAIEPDRGLVVDRMWVSRGGPGSVQWQPLP